ncbi:MAG: hypothetical protein ACMUEL_05060 [Flavobacteriales bacterium Tduv]
MSKTRWVAELIYVSINRWFGSGKTLTMETMEHNLYRLSRTIMSCS